MTLREHLVERHPRVPVRGRSLDKLEKAHRGEHHRYGMALTHYHAGVNTGPNDRPPGWTTGLDTIERNSR